MNGPIQLTPTRSYIESQILNEFSLSIDDKPSVSDDLIYTEAVFAGGRQTLEPLEKCLAECKARLERVVVNAKRENGKYRYEDFRTYWKDTCWKDFENTLSDIFGFHISRVQPYDDDPRAKYMSAWVYSNNRYPIEGLVTDRGFYDKSRSLIFDCVLSVGLIQAMEPEEMVAIVLHEIGHSIDPALADIRYGKVNALSKYLTDKRTDLIDEESRDYVKKSDSKGSRKKKRGIVAIVAVAVIAGLPALFRLLQRLFLGKKKMTEKQLKQIKKELEKEEYAFNRQNFSEAFADNFARMYGYAAPLASGFKKMEMHDRKSLKSWVTNDFKRQRYIVDIVISAIRDEHKTDVHRIHALLKEYDADIKDPTTPPAVKKQLEDDRSQLEKIYKAYANDFEDFQNKVNQLIMDSLEEEDNKQNDDSSKS